MRQKIGCGYRKQYWQNCWVSTGLDEMEHMKIILAFSGGLDTSFAVVYLKKKGHEIITVAVNTGGFTNEEMKKIEKRAIEVGSLKHYNINCENEFFDNLISKVIKANAVYDGKYPLLCADRYIIAEKVVEIAKKEKADAVAHGSTAMGNDQIRFDSAFSALAPNLKIISPIKDAMLSRSQEAEFLTKNGFPVENKSKKYSINENIMGITVSGSEIDEYEDPSQDAYKLTKQTEKKPIKLKITFENGVPVKIDGKKINGSEILKSLNKIIGGYGWGNDIYTGNCIIGIKGRILFEAPGLLALIKAHQALEQITLTKAQMDLSCQIRNIYANHVYNGLYYDPAVIDMEAFFDSCQKQVNGEVTLKIESQKLSVTSLKSVNSLHDKSVASYAQSCSWTTADADGFIKLYTLQEQLAAKRGKN